MLSLPRVTNEMRKAMWRGVEGRLVFRSGAKEFAVIVITSEQVMTPPGTPATPDPPAPSEGDAVTVAPRSNRASR